MPTIRIRVAGILVKDEKILLVQHEKGSRKYWLLPGGGIEFGESATEALVREFKEEVGMNISVGKMVFVHDSIPPDRHRQVLNIYFIVEALSHQIHVTPDAVLRDAAFYSLDDFSKMQVNPDIRSEILEEINNKWTGDCRYLGNRWKD